MGHRAEVEITDHLSILGVDHWVTHLPDGYWSTLKEPFYPESLVLVVKLWTGSIIRLYFKDGLLNPFISQILLKSSVKQCPWLLDVFIFAILNVNSIASIGKTTQSFYFNVV